VAGLQQAYYDGVDDLCERLRSLGEDAWATSLADAKRGGSTSGEILSHTGAVLHRLLFSPECDDLGLGDAVADLLSDGERIMNGAT
jgi:hypothetical protein